MKSFWLGVCFLATACSKKADDKPADPPPTQTKVVAPLSRVSITSKSEEAVLRFEQADKAAQYGRVADAMPQLRKVLELDPGFPRALALYGILEPTVHGTELLAKAKALAATLPAAERHLIEAIHAQRAGWRTEATALYEKVAALAPGQWEAKLQLAQFAISNSDAQRAIELCEQALAINPDVPPAYNMLAYAQGLNRQFDKAIANAKKQIELAPDEPNPHDTLGEIYLWAGKFALAEQAFDAAVTMTPSFTLAWQGIEIARAYQGDFKGAYEAIEKRKETTEPGGKQEAMFDAAWIAAAENKLPQAYAALAALDADPEARQLPIFAYAALARAQLLVIEGKYAEADNAYRAAEQRGTPLAGDSGIRLHRDYHFGRLRSAARAGTPNDEYLLHQGVRVSVSSREREGDRLAASDRALAKGLDAWAKGGPKAAVAELSKCAPEALECRFDLATTQRMAGDTAAAEATEKDLLARPMRDVVILWHHATLKARQPAK